MLLTYKVGHVYEVGIVLNRQYWVKKQLWNVLWYIYTIEFGEQLR